MIVKFLLSLSTNIWTRKEYFAARGGLVNRLFQHLLTIYRLVDYETSQAHSSQWDKRNFEFDPTSLLIMHGWEAVKKVCNSKMCTVSKVCTPPQDMLDMPVERVSDGPPFLHTGVDFAGPLYVSLNNQQQKVYMCLFTCTSTRGIHLELTPDLPAISYLQAFR